MDPPAGGAPLFSFGGFGANNPQAPAANTTFGQAAANTTFGQGVANPSSLAPAPATSASTVTPGAPLFSFGGFGFNNQQAPAATTTTASSTAPTFTAPSLFNLTPSLGQSTFTPTPASTAQTSLAPATSVAAITQVANPAASAPATNAPLFSFGGFGSNTPVSAANTTFGQATSNLPSLAPSTNTSAPFSFGGLGSTNTAQPTAATTTTATPASAAPTSSLFNLSTTAPTFGQANTTFGQANTTFGQANTTFGQAAANPTTSTPTTSAPATTTAAAPLFSFGGFGSNNQQAPAATTTTATSAAPTTSAPSLFNLTPTLGQTTFTSTPASTAPTSSTPAATVAATTQLVNTTASTPATSTPQFSFGGFGSNNQQAPATATTTTTTSSAVTSNATTTTPAVSTPTTTAQTTSAPPITQTMTFRQLEDQINIWTNDLNQLESDFHSQAQTINSWDSLLINNGLKITQIDSTVEKLREENMKLDRQLDFIVAQQNELEQLLEPLEKMKSENSSTDVVNAEREATYNLVETVQNDLQSIGDDLHNFIKRLNDTSTEEDTTNPINQIEMVLNAQMDALQWIENQIHQRNKSLAQ